MWLTFKNDSFNIGDYYAQKTMSGKTYKVGQSFIKPGCQGRCKCHPSGGIRCLQLCPLMRGRCRHGTRMTSVKYLIKGTKCSCSRPKCIPVKKPGMCP